VIIIDMTFQQGKNDQRQASMQALLRALCMKLCMDKASGRECPALSNTKIPF
jgi:hypothetical protein